MNTENSHSSWCPTVASPLVDVQVKVSVYQVRVQTWNNRVHDVMFLERNSSIAYPDSILYHKYNNEYDVDTTTETVISSTHWLLLYKKRKKMVCVLLRNNFSYPQFLYCCLFVFFFDSLSEGNYHIICNTFYYYSALLLSLLL